MQLEKFWRMQPNGLVDEVPRAGAGVRDARRRARQGVRRQPAIAAPEAASASAPTPASATADTAGQPQARKDALERLQTVGDRARAAVGRAVVARLVGGLADAVAAHGARSAVPARSVRTSSGGVHVPSPHPLQMPQSEGHV